MRLIKQSGDVHPPEFDDGMDEPDFDREAAPTSSPRNEIINRIAAEPQGSQARTTSSFGLLLGLGLAGLLLHRLFR